MSDTSNTNKRLAVLQRHLASATVEEHHEAHRDPASAQLPSTSVLYDWLVRDNAELREAIFDFMKDDLFKPNFYLSLMEFRDLTLRRLQAFSARGFFSVADYLREPLRFQAALEALSFCDYSLAIKAGVHYTLCGGTIAKLGTEKHHRKYFQGLDNLATPGCFGMTELGHGSNVMGIETTAEYDAASQQFILNTPYDEASKFWIGGAGQHGKICTIFAQLTVNGKWEGPHVFVVRLRDDAGKLAAGVRIRDNGPKMGLNGVDNGQIWLDHVRVPRDDLLDAFASVAADGTYSSPIKTVSARFGTMVGGLTTGRMLIAQGAVDACKIGVTIAVKYAAQRPQFGGKIILEYLTHQRRLFPALATTYAMHIALTRLKHVAAKRRPQDGKLVHVESSGLKAAATWHRIEILQNCRECCGGMGFLSANKIGPMLADMNVDATFEGDNTVMMQQVAKSLLDAASQQSKAQSPAAPAVSLEGDNLLQSVSQLLRFREEALTAEVGSKMVAAARSAGGKAAAAAAANDVYEAELDRVLELGWAHADRASFDAFAAELASAPASAKGALQLLCSLYGLTRLERNSGFYLGAGALDSRAISAGREHVNAACALLGANKGALALRLCDGFGVPDHLIAAPIAQDWRRIIT